MAGVAGLLLLIHIVGSVVAGEMVWWCSRRIGKTVIGDVLKLTGWGRRIVIVVEAEEVRLLVCHGGAVRW